MSDCLSRKKVILSIIIPVYKTEKYLIECLDSCLNQDIDHSEYEIICVDDGSPDNSGLILDEYSERHDNIKVLHKTNAGVSAARNDAINKSRGDYIWFIDSDDFIEKSSLGALTAVLKEANPGRMLVGLYKMVGEVLTDEEKVLRNAKSLKEDSHYLCGQVFDGRLIRQNNIRFHTDISIEEDTVFWFDYSIYQTRDTYDYKQIVYFYRNNPTSAMHMDELKMLPSYLKISTIMRDYKVREVGDILYADFKSTLQIYKAINVIVKLPIRKRREYIHELKTNGAFGFKPSQAAIQKMIDKKIKADPKLFSIAPTMKGYYVILCNYKIKQFKRKIRKVRWIMKKKERQK